MHGDITNDLYQLPVLPAVLDEFRWYCGYLQRVDLAPLAVVGLDAVRFQHARRAFDAPRVSFAAYRRWNQHGDASLNQL